jgi:hypothetical protein
MWQFFPGYPGPLDARTGLAPVTLPVVPLHPGGQPVGGPSPLSGLAARGVPVGQTPAGQCLLCTNTDGGASFMLPPEIPGMPGMPTPPNGMLYGGPQGGGLFQPMAPVAPFDMGNQVRQYQRNGQPLA